ncbi:MAG: multidrug effflux MFS transporter [Weeksellaceae bacterium]
MNLTSKQKVLLSLILGSVAALGPFSIDMYLPGFPAIAADFAVSENMVSYTLTSYFVGISLGQLFYGPILDKFGRKTPLMIGLGIYVIAAVGCAMAPDLTSLIIIRFFQALGASVGMVAGSAIIRDTFDDNQEVAKMLSSILLVMGVAPIIAPTVGSFFVEHYGWRSLFTLLAGIAITVIIALKFFLKETYGYHPEIELRLKPIARNYWSVLKVPSFLRFSMAGSISMSIMFAYISTIPMILMNIYEVSQSTFGILFGLNAGGFIIGSQVNRMLLKRIDLKRLTLIAMWTQLIIAILFILMAYSITLPLTLFCVLIFIILFLLGFINPNAMALSLESMRTNVGAASALNGSLRMGTGAIMTFLAGKLYDGTPTSLVWFILCLSFISILFVLKYRK